MAEVEKGQPLVDVLGGGEPEMVSACMRRDHWHVMTAVNAPGFAGKARRSRELWSWDAVLQYIEELTDDGGDTPWVEEHVYDSSV